MSTALDLFSRSSIVKQELLYTELQQEIDLPTLFRNIDAIPELLGAGVFYIDGNLTVVELREFQPICRINPVNIILKEAPQNIGSQDYAIKIKTERDSKLVGEMAGAALSCGAAIISWVVVIGSGAAVPLSGGATTFVTYLSISAGVASSAQCVNGAYRVYNEITTPQSNDSLDSKEWYSIMMSALDAISLAGAAAAGAATIKAVLVLKRSTTRTLLQLLQGLSRAERKRITEEVIRMNHPGISNNKLRALIKSGVYPQRFKTVEIGYALQLQLKDAIGATLSFTGSALSGNIKQIAIGIYE